jgi:hypothetical protein
VSEPLLCSDRLRFQDGELVGGLSPILLKTGGFVHALAIISRTSFVFRVTR